MKEVSLFLVLMITGASTWSASNPQMRACRAASGQYFILDTGLDEIGFCRLGPSVIGAIDLLNKDAAMEEAPASLSDYRDGIADCEPSNVSAIPNGAGNILKVCYYDDGSIIDLQTLSRGKNHSLNWQLNRALGLD